MQIVGANPLKNPHNPSLLYICDTQLKIPRYVHSLFKFEVLIPSAILTLTTSSGYDIDFCMRPATAPAITELKDPGLPSKYKTAYSCQFRLKVPW